MMTRSNTSISAIALTAILTMSFQPLVLAEQQARDINWIMVGDSPTLDRSSTFLANGNTKSGIRFANRALQRSQSPLKTMIANHNLCFALMLEGNDTEAKVYCDRMQTLPMPEVSLKQVRQGLYKVTKRSTDIKLGTLITQNLADIQTGNRLVQKSE